MGTVTTTTTKEPSLASPGLSGVGTSSGRTLLVRGPHTGGVLGEVPDLDATQVAEQVARARAAQPAWAGLGVEARAEVLDRYRRLLWRRRGEVLRYLQAESGKTYEDALRELAILLDWAHYWSRAAGPLLADEPIRTRGLMAVGRRSVRTFEPHGVVGVIGPWNFPVMLSIGDSLPALMAGNTVVCKPSEVTPLATAMAAELFVAAGGPPDVLLVATGGGRTGEALIDHVDAVHFTGSVATGRAVAARAGQRLIPCALELGGKDPMIVLADADLERAARGAVNYGLANGGQICMAVERVYVERDVYERFVDLVVQQVRSLRLGPAGGPGAVDVTGMIHPPQVDIVDAHVRDAVERGARVLTGGRRGPAAAGYEPTVLVDVDHTMRCMREETFGPVIPIMAVRDADEAVLLANDSEYGLTASVWTDDPARGKAVARQLEAGTVTVNDAMMHSALPELPMGGWKTSGLGGRGGAEAMRWACRQRIVQVLRTTGHPDLGWLPYRPRSSRSLERLFGRLYGR
ncbi:MAG: aldehyde dehydrogenase family protein [Nitriliruptor sp.]|nr:MAG: aldehyde dehydrogenase family protein [Nitriliruptor sp.]